MTERVRKHVCLPMWAVAAIAKADINVLIDRCEHETILIENCFEQPTVVMISHDEWRRLIEARNAARRERGNDDE